ncbi:unnamed protein product [Leptosia nina]|uniref:Nuclease HARBI1 n=1 Tax=Leptosia nina TaxID=320188 RepID=A0AAV1K0C6_9NEOP
MSFQLSLRVLSLAASVDRYNQSQRQARTEQYISDPFEMPNVLFIKTYRLTKPMVQNLIRTLSPVIPKLKRRDALSVKEKVLIALAFYATGSYQTLVGQSKYHCVSQSTISRAIRQVTKALNNHHIFKSFVKFPSTREERDVIKRRFYRKFKLPGVLGCIDGTHVAIIRPNQHEERYFNRKGYHSLNVMVVSWDREIEEQLTVRRRALERGLNISSDISRQEQGNRRPNLDLLEGQTVQRALINRLWQQRET